MVLFRSFGISGALSRSYGKGKTPEDLRRRRRRLSNTSNLTMTARPTYSFQCFCNIH